MVEPQGCAVKLQWLNHGKVFVKLRWLHPIRHKRGFWWGEMLTLVVKPQWGRYKPDETIKKPCSDFLVHTSKVCKGIPSVQWVSGCQG
jgi:hypothetical protein